MSEKWIVAVSYGAMPSHYIDCQLVNECMLTSRGILIDFFNFAFLMNKIMHKTGGENVKLQKVVTSMLVLSVLINLHE